MRRSAALVSVSAAVSLLAATPAIAGPQPASQSPQSRPARVSHLRVGSRSDRAIGLHWDNPHDPGFRGAVVRLHRGPVSVVSPQGPKGRLVARLGRHRHSLRIRGLTPGADYSFIVRARYTRRRISAPRVLTTATLPGRVTSLGVYNDGSANIVQWRPPARGQFEGVVLRYAQGRRAPATLHDGSPVYVYPDQTAAQLPALLPGRRYSLAAWTVGYFGSRPSPRVVTHFRTPAAPSEATVSGTVSDTAGHALDNVVVEAWSIADFSATTTTTDSSGNYRLKLATGRYFLAFSGSDATGGMSDDTGYLYDGRAVSVVSKQSVTANGRLAPGGAISGRMVDQSGQPVAGAVPAAQSVTPYVYPDDSLSFYEYAFPQTFEGAVTASDGTFVIKGLAPGSTWRLCSASLVSASAVCGRQAFHVTPGTFTVGGDVLHAPSSGGVISGTLVGTDGSPVGEAEVYAQQVGGHHYGYAVSTDDGRYLMDGLAPGTYRLCAATDTSLVTGTSPSGYASTCAPDTVEVAAGATSTADLRLPLGAALTGVVTTVHGAPVSGVSVYVEPAGNTESLGYLPTDAHGRYRITDLPAGAYRVCVSTLGYRSAQDPHGLLRGCYDGGQRVTVERGLTRVGIDIPLRRAAGAITGRVVDTSGHPLRGITVSVSQDSRGSGEVAATTGPAGRYVLAGLRSDSYGVCVAADGWLPQPGDPCFGHHSWRSPARPVTVRQGRTTRGIDIVEKRTATLSVAVHDTSGHPLTGVDAVLVAPCSRAEFCQGLALYRHGAAVRVVDSADTGDSGVWTFSRLAAGHYAVCLFGFYAVPPSGAPPTGYADHCSAGGMSIVVAQNGSTSASETLRPGGEVDGRVVDADRNPVRGVRVHVSNSAVDDYQRVDPLTGRLSPFFTDDGPSGFAVTDADGRYAVPGVVPGTQTVCVHATRAHPRECVGGRSPTPVPVTADAVSQAPDLVLAH